MSNSVHKITLELQILLEKAVKKNLAQGILLSGGLDTSILAVVASKFVSLKAFTVALQGAPAPDVKYATLMANRLRLKHSVHYFGEDELYDGVKKVVKTLKSFDPMEIRNSAAVYVGLKMAKENGVNAVMTGDGCDELFAGYSFFFNLEKERLDLKLRKMWRVMSFSSVPLAKAIGVEAKLPFLDANFKAFAMKIDSQYKTRSEEGRVLGKWIIRKAYEDFLPKEIVWRAKVPIEKGSGTTTLPSRFSQKISDPEFREKKANILTKTK
jgi:asparagine synthase (glutamine-hydrolysing)